MLCDLLFAVCCGLDPDLLYTQTIPENRGPELMLEILTYFCYTHHHTQNRVGMCPRAGPAERYIKVGMSGDDKYMVKGLLTMFPMHEEPVSAHGLWEKVKKTFRAPGATTSSDFILFLHQGFAPSPALLTTSYDFFLKQETSLAPKQHSTFGICSNTWEKKTRSPVASWKTWSKRWIQRCRRRKRTWVATPPFATATLLRTSTTLRKSRYCSRDGWRSAARLCRTPRRITNAKMSGSGSRSCVFVMPLYLDDAKPVIRVFLLPHHASSIRGRVRFLCSSKWAIRRRHTHAATQIFM
ncbi:unnamed protein product [Amoebophrya sp. A120]|nr:unnamed protein product [Amoebophrya sp. A120]|eukprot:GSA120T00025079001.1